MISGWRLLKLARKWHKCEDIKRKQIKPLQDVESVEEQGDFGASALAAKGHFVVYTIDHKRFSLPLKYLNNDLIRELFSMAEEEFGLPSEGPLVLPCEAEVLDCVISLIKENINGDIQQALARSILTGALSLYHRHQETRNRLLMCSF